MKRLPLDVQVRTGSQGQYCSFKPDAAWMTEQAAGFLAHAKAQDMAAGVVLRDHDCKYTAAAFDGTLEAEDPNPVLKGSRLLSGC